MQEASPKTSKHQNSDLGELFIPAPPRLSKITHHKFDPSPQVEMDSNFTNSVHQNSFRLSSMAMKHEETTDETIPKYPIMRVTHSWEILQPQQ